MKYRVYTEYDPIRILIPVSESVDLDAEAIKAGLTGNFQLVEKEDFPSNRNDREAWKFNGSKVEVDTAKKGIIDQRRSEKEKEKKDILSKLGITQEQLKRVL